MASSPSPSDLQRGEGPSGSSSDVTQAIASSPESKGKGDTDEPIHGHAALAQLMTSDSQYSFLPCFRKLSHELLLEMASEIVGWERKAERQTLGQGTSSAELAPDDTAMKVKKLMRTNVDNFFAAAKKILDFSQPPEIMTDCLRGWAGRNHPEWYHLLNDTDPIDFRCLECKSNRVDALISNTMRKYPVARLLFAPFKSETRTQGGVKIQIYPPRALRIFYYGLTMLFLSVFALVPMALFAFRPVSPAVALGVGFALATAFLVMVSLRTRPDQIQVSAVLILAYVTFIVQVAGNVVG